MTRDPKLLTLLGEMIVASDSEDKSRTAANVVEMHSQPDGAEMLRLIVRDDLGGAAEIIASALMPNL